MITKRQTAVDPNNFDPNDVVVVGSDGVVQGGGVTGASDVRNDYWNPANNLIVQLGILAAVLLIIASYLIIGAIHVRWRAKRGLPPKWYHKFLLPNKYKDQFEGQQNQFMAQPIGFDQDPYGNGRQNSYGQDPYGNNDYEPPPPTYAGNHDDSRYPLPDGATKVNPDQGHYILPPPGALPGRHEYDDQAPGYPEATYAPGGRY